MKKTARDREHARIVIMAASIAIILIVSVLLASENDMWDSSLECATYETFENDRASDYLCKGHFVIDEGDGSVYAGVYPEYDIYCRAYELLPSAHDIEDVMKREPLSRPSGAKGGVMLMGSTNVNLDAEAFKNPTAIVGTFSEEDEPYFVCEARKIVEEKLEWIDCREENDVGICKDSEIKWTLYANYNGVSERMETKHGRWIVINSNEFTKIEIEHKGVIESVGGPAIAPEPEPAIPPIGGLF